MSAVSRYGATILTGNTCGPVYTPALWMTASIRPRRFTSPATARVCSRSDRSPTTAAAPRSTSSRTALSRSLSRAWTTTSCPSSSSVCAAARPRPSAEPVMKTRAIRRHRPLVSAPGWRWIRAGPARLVEQRVAGGERCPGAAPGKGAQDQPRGMVAVVEDRVPGRGRTQKEVPAAGLARRVDDHADGRAGPEDMVEREDLDAREDRRQRRQQFKVRLLLGLVRARDGRALAVELALGGPQPAARHVGLLAVRA